MVVHKCSTGLSCPPAEFLEEPFLRSAREALVEGGILAVNVVSRASSPHITSVALLQKVVTSAGVAIYMQLMIFARECIWTAVEWAPNNTWYGVWIVYVGV